MIRWLFLQHFFSVLDHSAASLPLRPPVSSSLGPDIGFLDFAKGNQVFLGNSFFSYDGGKLVRNVR